MFAYYDEYAIYGWIKANDPIPTSDWVSIFRLSNWYNG